MRDILRPGLCVLLALLLAGCQVGERNEGDSDGDFLDDLVEASGWNITVQFATPECFVDGATAPAVEVEVFSHTYERDSDYDGLEDLLEYTIGSDPGSNDTDEDGILDGDEYALTRGGSLRFPGDLSLNRADSDGDCIPDRDELDGFDVPGLGMRTTDPTTRDTDGDGLSDPHEVFRSHTDPRLSDSDGDGANDRFDVQPLRNLGIELVFESVRPKQNLGSDRLRIIYAVPTADGSVSEDRAAGFVAPMGQDTAVPASASPGVVDVDDAAADGALHIDVLGVISEAAQGGRTSGCGSAFDVVPGVDDCIGVARVAWQNATWTMQGPDRFAADGSAVTIETADIRLVLRLSVVEL